MRNRIGKLGWALIGGVAVFASGVAVDLALLGHDRRTYRAARCCRRLVAASGNMYL